MARPAKGAKPKSKRAPTAPPAEVPTTAGDPAPESLPEQKIPQTARGRFLKRFQRTAPSGKGIPIIDLEGIGPVYAAKLTASGINDSEHLLRADGRVVAERAKVPYTEVRKWQDMAELLHVKGIGPQFAEVLVRCDINSVAELAQQEPDALAARVQTYLGSLDSTVVRVTITPKLAKGWVKQARRLAMPVKDAGAEALQRVTRQPDEADLEGNPEEVPAGPEPIEPQALAEEAKHESERGFMHRFGLRHKPPTVELHEPTHRKPSLFHRLSRRAPKDTDQVADAATAPARDETECANCGHTFVVPQGKTKVDCPKCGSRLKVLAEDKGGPPPGGASGVERAAAKAARVEAKRQAKADAVAARAEARTKKEEERQAAAQAKAAAKAALQAGAPAPAEAEGNASFRDEPLAGTESLGATSTPPTNSATETTQQQEADAKREAKAARQAQAKADKEARQLAKAQSKAARQDAKTAARLAQEDARRISALAQDDQAQRAAAQPTEEPTSPANAKRLAREEAHRAREQQRRELETARLAQLAQGGSLWEQAVSQPLPGARPAAGTWDASVEAGANYTKADPWEGAEEKPRFARMPKPEKQHVRLVDGASPFARLPEDEHARAPPRLADGQSPFARLPDDERNAAPPPRLPDGRSAFVVLPEDIQSDSERIHAFGHRPGLEYTTKGGFHIKEEVMETPAPAQVDLGKPASSRKAEREAELERREKAREARQRQLEETRQAARQREDERRAEERARREAQRAQRRAGKSETPTESVASADEPTTADLPSEAEPAEASSSRRGRFGALLRRGRETEAAPLAETDQTGSEEAQVADSTADEPQESQDVVQPLSKAAAADQKTARWRMPFGRPDVKPAEEVVEFTESTSVAPLSDAPASAGDVPDSSTVTAEPEVPEPLDPKTIARMAKLEAEELARQEKLKEREAKRQRQEQEKLAKNQVKAAKEQSPADGQSIGALAEESGRDAAVAQSVPTIDEQENKAPLEPSSRERRRLAKQQKAEERQRRREEQERVRAEERAAKAEAQQAQREAAERARNEAAAAKMVAEQQAQLDAERAQAVAQEEAAQTDAHEQAQLQKSERQSQLEQEKAAKRQEQIQRAAELQAAKQQETAEKQALKEEKQAQAEQRKRDASAARDADKERKASERLEAQRQAIAKRAEKQQRLENERRAAQERAAAELQEAERREQAAQLEESRRREAEQDAAQARQREEAQLQAARRAEVKQLVTESQRSEDRVPDRLQSGSGAVLRPTPAPVSKPPETTAAASPRPAPKPAPRPALKAYGYDPAKIDAILQKHGQTPPRR